jgi:hypothetical protein
MSSLARYTFQSLYLFSHKGVEVVVVVCLHSVEGDGWPSPDNGHHLIGPLITCSGVRVRRSKVGLDLDLVATKHWLDPMRLLRVPSLLKPAVERCNSKLLFFSVVAILKLVSFVGRALRCLLLRGASALPRRCTRVWLSCPVNGRIALNQVGRQIASRECASPLLSW